MVSLSDNPNFLFMEPFITWAQETYQGSTGLRIFKRLSNNSTVGSYCVLTNIGKKKTIEPVTVYVKILKTGIKSASIDIYDTLIKKQIHFEVDNETFDFQHKKIDETTSKTTSNYKEAPYDHDQVLEGLSRGSSPSLQPQYQLPSSAESGSASSETSTEHTHEVSLLKEELEKSTCENLILTIEREALLRKLVKPSPTELNIMNFRIIRTVTYSMGIRVYAVEHVITKKKYNLKEYIFDRYAPETVKFALKAELDLLKELRNIPLRSKHISYLLDEGQDITIIRQSHYLLTEPAVSNLEEFAMSFMKEDKSLANVVVTQILEGIYFLNSNLGRIHGNIDAKSIIIDQTWTVKLSSFGLSHKLGTTVDPLRLLNGENDLLVKHPYIFERAEGKKPISVSYALDLWSLGCLYYRLVFDTELFLESPTYKTHPAIIMRLNERPYGKVIASFLNNYMSEITPGHLLQTELFRCLRDYNIGEHIHRQQQQGRQEGRVELPKEQQVKH